MRGLGCRLTNVRLRRRTWCGALPQVPTADIFRGTLPFLWVQFANVALILAFPQIVLWLPQTMGLLR